MGDLSIHLRRVLKALLLLIGISCLLVRPLQRQDTTHLAGWVAGGFAQLTALYSAMLYRPRNFVRRRDEWRIYYYTKRLADHGGVEVEEAVGGRNVGKFFFFSQRRGSGY